MNIDQIFVPGCIRLSVNLNIVYYSRYIIILLVIFKKKIFNLLPGGCDKTAPALSPPPARSCVPKTKLLEPDSVLKKYRP